MNEHEWHLFEDKSPVESVLVGSMEVKQGGRVKLRPRQGGDIFDLALAGKIATVESIEQDYEGRFHLSVVLEDDPGKDMGMLRQPGHRFFFEPEEVEPLAPEDHASSLSSKPRILIAGIGNIFLGDDAFGVEAIARLAQVKFPEDVHVKDFGIRGFDLAYALLDGAEATILIDACSRGDVPGTLYVMELDEKSQTEDGSEDLASGVETHGMNPMNVLRMAKSMEGNLNRVLLVGCEPETFGPEEGFVGLSKPVTAALDETVRLVESLVQKILAGEELELQR